MSKYPARLYRYVGSSEIQLHVAGSPIGKRIQSVSELSDWIAQTKKEPNAWELIPATFVIDVEGYLRVADRHSEHNEVERYYIIFLPNSVELELLSFYAFKQLHSIHWGIECYPRAIKQLCGIERFMVRTTDALKTHFFCAIRAFTQLELMRTENLIENWYELQRNLSLQIARQFILEHLKHKMGLNAY